MNHVSIIERALATHQDLALELWNLINDPKYDALTKGVFPIEFEVIKKSLKRYSDVLDDMGYFEGKDGSWLNSCSTVSITEIMEGLIINIVSTYIKDLLGNHPELRKDYSTATKRDYFNDIDFRITAEKWVSQNSNEERFKKMMIELVLDITMIWGKRE